MTTADDHVAAQSGRGQAVWRLPYFIKFLFLIFVSF